jgi:tetratricopeptide (TPR) repeat protein
MFLAASLWVAFDAPFSGRSLMRRKLQGIDELTSGTPFLTFYYLAALAIGYFVGYFLLIFGHQPGRTRLRQSPGILALSKVMKAVIWVVIILAPIGLFRRNYPVIRASDGGLLREFAGLASERLQSGNRIGLSDQPQILSLVDIYTRQLGTKPGVILADTGLLPYPKYQRSLHKSHPKLWPEPPPFPVPTLQLSSLYLMQEITDLSASNLLYYLHPSFGYYFENVYLEPAGLTYRVIPYPTNEVGAPAMSRAETDANNAFWKRIEPNLGRLSAAVNTGASDARVLSRWYSRAINLWGVELQKTGRLKEAGEFFALALKVNPQNFSAEINRASNQRLQSGTPRSRDGIRLPEDRFGGRYRSWDDVLAANGPIDEPAFCFQLAQSLVQQSLFRQAAIQLLRSLQLEPDNLDARLWLANVYLLGHVSDKALEITRDIRARRGPNTLQTTNEIELIRIDAIANIQSDRFQKGEEMLLNARKQFQGARVIDDTLLQVYLQMNRLTNALALIGQQLEQTPGNPVVLMNQALVYLRIPDYARAAATVSEVLKRDPNNVRALIASGTISIQTQAYPEALATLDQALRIQPENVDAMLTKSAALIQTRDFEGALKLLDRALKLQPENQAVLLNHAIASLQSHRLADARRDYEKLQIIAAPTHSVYFGLGEIAYQQKNFPEAIQNFEVYLKLAPPDTKEAKDVAERLRQMKSGAP